MVEGTFTPEHPRVVSNSGTTATVSDCVWDATVEYYKASDGGTPEAVPNQPGGTQPKEMASRWPSRLSRASGWPRRAQLEVDNCTGY